jgi:hypothetical protein
MTFQGQEAQQMPFYVRKSLLASRRVNQYNDVRITTWVAGRGSLLAGRLLVAILLLAIVAAGCTRVPTNAPSPVPSTATVLPPPSPAETVEPTTARVAITRIPLSASPPPGEASPTAMPALATPVPSIAEATEPPLTPSQAPTSLPDASIPDPSALEPPSTASVSALELQTVPTTAAVQSSPTVRLAPTVQPGSISQLAAPSQPSATIQPSPTSRPVVPELPTQAPPPSPLVLVVTATSGPVTPTLTPAPPTPTAMPTLTPTSTATPTPTATVVHLYYLSTYPTAHEYYCDDDPAWKELSLEYRVGPISLAQVLAQYPGRTLHESC